MERTIGDCQFGGNNFPIGEAFAHVRYVPKKDASLTNMDKVDLESNSENALTISLFSF
jgi:hypothetical protein